MFETFLKGLIGNFLLFFEKSGYLGVFFLMALESTLVPIPSEIIVPPAGYLASQGKLNLWGVILAATLGSLAGALVNYYLALKLGRPALLRFLKRYGKYLLLTEVSFKKVEIFWNHHGPISTFVGRLLPGMRHIISIPAGLVRMGLIIFSFYTTVGAFLWCSFLAFCGYYLGKNEEALKEALHQGSYGIIILVLIILGIYLLWKVKGRN